MLKGVWGKVRTTKLFWFSSCLKMEWPLIRHCGSLLLVTTLRRALSLRIVNRIMENPSFWNSFKNFKLNFHSSPFATRYSLYAVDFVSIVFTIHQVPIAALWMIFLDLLFYVNVFPSIFYENCVCLCVFVGLSMLYLLLLF